MAKRPKKKKKKKAKKGERRNSPREPGCVFACILEESRFRKLDQAFCVVMDVSERGMRLRTPQPPLAGSMVTLRVAVGEDICSIQGQVVRVEEISPSTFDVGLVLDMDAFSANVFLQAVRDNHVQLEMAPKS